MNSVEVHQIMGKDDSRGISFQLPRVSMDFLGKLAEMHYATINPGFVRGNHYHRWRKELLFVHLTSSCQLVWQPVATQSLHTQAFSAVGSIIIHIEPDVIHAIKNTGNATLHIVACSNCMPVASDTERVRIWPIDQGR
jgi:dTDP-4-dehydrorhamnose 3,5-epimerase-like enzyme